MRKSSRGNNYHVPAGSPNGGQFTSPNRNAVKSNKRDYDKQTRERGKKILTMAKSPLGTVAFTQQSRMHCKYHHPGMDNWKNVKAVQDVLQNPDKVYKSKDKRYDGESKKREVFFGRTTKGTFGNKVYYKVIVKTVRGKKEVVSAWPQKEIKGNIGELIYEKE